MAEEGQQALWNVDGAQLYVIFTIKTEASIALASWDLETAYWKLRNLRREIDAKLNDSKKESYSAKEIIKDKKGKDVLKSVTKQMTQKQYVDNLLDQLGDERVIFYKSSQSDADMSRFYLSLEQFYMELARLMKAHGLFLREGEDPSEAYRRR